MSRLVQLGLKAAIGAAIFVAIGYHVDFAAAATRLSSVNLFAFFTATALIIGQHYFAAARWKSVIEACGASLPLRTCLFGYLEANFFNQALPSSIGGDAIRVWRSQASGLGIGMATLGVVLDRAFGLLMLGCLTLFCGAALLSGEASQSAGLAVLAVSMAIIAGAAAGGSLSSLFPAMKTIPVLRPIYHLSEGVRRIMTSPRHAISVLGNSLAGHLVTVIAFSILAKGMNLNIGLWGALLSLPAILLTSAVPLSINGWGVREATTVAVLTQLQLETSENALALGLLFGLCLLAVGLAGGVVWMIDGALDEERSNADVPKERPNLDFNDK